MDNSRSENLAKAAQEGALADWNAGRLANELYDKKAERGFSHSEVERVLTSNWSGVWRYRHWLGQRRYGFWHPESQLFVAWQPGEEGQHSQIKTCFYRPHIENYVADLPEIVSLREPKG